MAGVAKLVTMLAVCSIACEGGSQSEAARRAAGTGTSVQADTSHSAAADTAPAVPAMSVTIDDLPWIGAVRPGQTRADALRSLVEALKERGVPAVGFVNCDRVEPGAPLLRLWREAGLELGNHTAAHLDLNDAPLQQWLSDVRSCHETVRDHAGSDAAQVWFRFPYLHQGPSPERQQAALDVLREIGSPVAHVTIDNSDWILAVAYGEAVRNGNQRETAAIGEAFVLHILRATEHYQAVARQKAGSDVPHVLLLHANLLVADHIGTLIDRLRSEHGFRFVSLEAAQQHPIYDREDEYIGPDGLSWLYRMAPATPEMAEWDDAEALRLRSQWR